MKSSIIAEFSTVEAAKKCVEVLNGTEINGFKITVLMVSLVYSVCDVYCRAIVRCFCIIHFLSLLVF